MCRGVEIEDEKMETRRNEAIEVERRSASAHIQSKMEAEEDDQYTSRIDNDVPDRPPKPLDKLVTAVLIPER